MHVNLILQDFGRKVASARGKHYKLDGIRLMPSFIKQVQQIFEERKVFSLKYWPYNELI